MGRFKEQNRKGIGEIQENSRETTELGSEMLDAANEIDAVLKSIELMDEEDVEKVSATGRSYQESFDTAYDDQVETAGEEIEQQGAEVTETISNELENVESGIGSMEQAEGISEIGRDAAETAKGKLEGSADEYQDYISETEDIVKSLNDILKETENKLGGVFGSR